MAGLDFVPVAFWALGAAVVFQTAACIVAIRMKRVDVVDVFWGLSFIVIALTGFTLSPVGAVTHAVVPIMVLVWGLRLSWHIYRRFSRSHEQDPRYTDLLVAMPSRYRSIHVYVRIFLVQAVLAWLVSIPVLVAVTADTVHYTWLAIGVLVWIFGFVFESLADKQLADFLRDNSKQGGLMTEGLWRYSRHPNYFGEVTQWWGIWLTALATPLGWFAIIGPLTITLLILKVSGVPLAEKRSRTKPGWKQYAATTSVLLPLPPRR